MMCPARGGTGTRPAALWWVGTCGSCAQMQGWRPNLLLLPLLPPLVVLLVLVVLLQLLLLILPLLLLLV